MQSKPHQLENGRHMAALAIGGPWALGVTMIDPRATLGAFLCLFCVAITIWVYSSDLAQIRYGSPKKWPWIAIVIIAMEVIYPIFVIVSRASAEQNQVASVASTPAPIAEVSKAPVERCRTTGIKVQGGSDVEIADNILQGFDCPIDLNNTLRSHVQNNKMFTVPQAAPPLVPMPPSRPVKK